MGKTHLTEIVSRNAHETIEANGDRNASSAVGGEVGWDSALDGINAQSRSCAGQIGVLIVSL